jgi:hypothetical protein
MICSIFLRRSVRGRFLATPDVLRAFFSGESSQSFLSSTQDSCSRRISKPLPHRSREPINLTNSPLGEGSFFNRTSVGSMALRVPNRFSGVIGQSWNALPTAQLHLGRTRMRRYNLPTVVKLLEVHGGIPHHPLLGNREGDRPPSEG